MMIFFGQSKEIEQDLVIAFNLRKLILTEKIHNLLHLVCFINYFNLF